MFLEVLGLGKKCEQRIPESLNRLVFGIILGNLGGGNTEPNFRADFWEGDATKHFSVKKGVFSEKGGGNSVNERLGKDFYRRGNSVKRFGPFTEPPDSEN